MGKAGRPSKTTVDYFPHDTSQRKTLFVLKSKYGLEGYSFWFQLLEILGHTPGHCYDCRPPENQEYITAYMLIEWERCLQIITTLTNLGAIDPELWDKNMVLWSDNFVERLVPLYAKRDTLCPMKPPLTIISGEIITISGTGNTQTKLKETKLTKDKTFLSDSDEIRLAEYFIGLLDNRGYEWKGGKKPDPQKWAADFDKLIRTDKRTPERIREVLNWCQADGNFWQPNILSPSKLRDKWGQLTEQMKNGGRSRGANRSGSAPTNGPGGGEYDPTYGEKEYRA